MLFLVQVNDFILRVHGSTSLYGLQAETLDSLILDLLPPLNHSYCKLGEDSMVDTSEPVPIYLLHELLGALRSNAGFHVVHSYMHVHVSKMPSCSTQLHACTYI